jgi:hypothetical protein
MFSYNKFDLKIISDLINIELTINFYLKYNFYLYPFKKLCFFKCLKNYLGIELQNVSTVEVHRESKVSSDKAFREKKFVSSRILLNECLFVNILPHIHLFFYQTNDLMKNLF